MAYIFSSAALIISVASFFLLFFYVKRRTAVDRIAPETRREVAQIINEIDRITDRDSTLIEDRVNKLKLLLEDIDRRIAARETLLNNYKAAEETQKKLNDEKKEAVVEAYRELGKKKFAVSQKTSTINETADAGERERISQVAEMSAAGTPPYEIAKRLHITINEVEMALFLSKR
ncbi:MAG: hypothetical protein LBC27_04730 [Spirochaetaceae bacterium]|jgi:uncharacterized protein YoxC|nr:hypothetical protein [Spirochaetaceae bacterium]